MFYLKPDLVLLVKKGLIVYEIEKKDNFICVQKIIKFKVETENLQRFGCYSRFLIVDKSIIIRHRHII